MRRPRGIEKASASVDSKGQDKPLTFVHVQHGFQGLTTIGTYQTIDRRKNGLEAEAFRP